MNNCCDALFEAIKNLKTLSPQLMLSESTLDLLFKNPEMSVEKPKKKIEVESKLTEECSLSFPELLEKMNHCQACELSKKAIQPLPFLGGISPDILWITDLPSEQEDKAHALLEGKSGMLLKNMILATEVPLEKHAVTSIIKCFPGRNTVPTAAQIHTCLRYLHQQIRLLKPRVIILVGYTAALHTTHDLATHRHEKLVGTWLSASDIPAMPVYSPVYLQKIEKDTHLLREKKMESWIALQKVMQYLKSNEK